MGDRSHSRSGWSGVYCTDCTGDGVLAAFDAETMEYVEAQCDLCEGTGEETVWIEPAPELTR